MMRGAFACALCAWLSVAQLGCGDTRAKVLSRAQQQTPPSSTPRMDVLLVRSLATCAAGDPCTSSDPTQCYYVTNATGARMTFDPDTVQLLAANDPGVAAASKSVCFNLTLSDAQVATAQNLLKQLHTQVFQLTGGDINLDLHFHDVPTVDAYFTRYPAGLFLPPSALEPAAIRDVNRETDFVFAITGMDDPAAGLTPRIDPCAGTNWIEQGSFGGSTFTWIAATDACAQYDTFLRAWLAQLYFGLRDVTGFGTAVPGSSAACGQGGPDPTRWFPWIGDCTTDPDALTCGDTSCPDDVAFYDHVLTAHWTYGTAFNGNYCGDGRMDFDETGIDSGGHCDLLAP